MDATMSSLSFRTNLFYTSRRSTLISVESSTTGTFSVTDTKYAAESFEGRKERIKKLFDKVELSVSSYDTAWTAMVPCPNSPEVPCFPECVNWLLSNQLQDGSWGQPHQRHQALTKDRLSSTLACVLALKRWGVGHQNIINGLQFIESNFDSIVDEKQQSPIGFDIIFPGMIERARDLNMNLPMRATEIDAMLGRRDLELKRGNKSESEGRKAYLAYVSEGVGESQDWATVANKYQRRNGSIFNSPSATAAFLTHLPNVGGFDYLRSLVNLSGAAVPAIYPLHIHCRLHMVDTLGRLGIERHFDNEIATVLDETYRLWLEGGEEIFKDTATCAMAFRILRHNGYEVSSDPLAQFAEEGYFLNTLEGYMKDTCTVLELYKASHMIIHPHESFLDQIQSWTSRFLKQESSIQTNNKLNQQFCDEVDYALMFPFYTNMERLATRRNIEHYNVDSTRVVKTSYSCPNMGSKDFLNLAVEDFNANQKLYLKEFEEFNKWVVEKRLDKVRYMKHKIGYCYYTAAANFHSPELLDARVSWAKYGLLSSVIDEWFDNEGHGDDKVELVQLVDKWDVNACCSEEVGIIFKALHSAACETVMRARECNLTGHIRESWLEVVKSMLKEAEWGRSGYVPSMDEYFANANHSIALTPIMIPTVFFMGAKISQQTLQNPQFHNLCHLTSTIGRLLNDTQTYQREANEGKHANAVSLRVMHSNGDVNEDKAIKELKGVISEQRRELLRLVVQKRACLVPRACKEVFWMMSKVVHLVYMKDDDFHTMGMMKDLTAIVHQPIILNQRL